MVASGCATMNGLLRLDRGRVPVEGGCAGGPTSQASDSKLVNSPTIHSVPQLYNPPNQYATYTSTRPDLYPARSVKGSLVCARVVECVARWPGLAVVAQTPRFTLNLDTNQPRTASYTVDDVSSCVIVYSTPLERGLMCFVGVCVCVDCVGDWWAGRD